MIIDIYMICWLTLNYVLISPLRYMYLSQKCKYNMSSCPNCKLCSVPRFSPDFI